MPEPTKSITIFEKLISSQSGFYSRLPECPRLVNPYPSASGVPALLPECPLHWHVDLYTLEKVGLYETVQSMLSQQYSPPNGNDYDYEYEEWEYLICTDPPVFQELCWEFHSTYIFKENPEDMKDEDFMRFKLGGRPYHMSLDDFTKCLKLYSAEEMSEHHFSDYIWSGARVSAMNDKDFDANNVWKKFSSATSWYHHGDGHGDGDGDGMVSSLCIDMDDFDVEFRLIHLFLTLNIFHRTEDTDKVSLSDLWYMEQIRSKTHVNIPFCVAYYLKHFASSVTGGGGQTICGGRFVTLIAHHLGVKYDQSAGYNKFTCLRGPDIISFREYCNAKVISVSEFGEMTRFKPEPPEVVVVVEEEEEEEDLQQHGDDWVYEYLITRNVEQQ